MLMRISLIPVLFFTCLIFTSYYVPYPESIGVNRVVLDAGHGGKDPGAIGVKGMKEKDLALFMALEVGNAIKKNFPEVEVIYTRDKDVFVELFERARIANNRNADLFISFHANSAASATAYGTETWVLGLHKSQENLEVAKKENSVILMEDDYEVQYDGFLPNSNESYIALALRQSVFLEQSLNFAAKIQEKFTSLGRRDRGVKQAGFLVLYKTTMPSVLIEAGFVNHPNEGAYLSSEKNLKDLSNSVYEAFAEYKNQIEERSSMMKETQHPVEKVEKIEEKKQENLSQNDKAESAKELKIEESQLKEALKANTHQQSEEPIKSSSFNKPYFTVQIVSSAEAINNFKEYFSEFADVQEYKVGNVYKYTTGKDYDLSKAVELQKKVRQSKYKDAFVIAIKGGERIQISEALELLKKKP